MARTVLVSIIRERVRITVGSRHGSDRNAADRTAEAPHSQHAYDAANGGIAVFDAYPAYAADLA